MKSGIQISSDLHFRSSTILGRLMQNKIFLFLLPSYELSSFMSCKSLSSCSLINCFYTMSSSESWLEVMIPRVPSSGVAASQAGEAVSHHCPRGSDSCLISHHDVHWTRSTSPCTLLRMALETRAQRRIYLSCSKQFRWQQSHPLYKRQQKERKSDMLDRTKPPVTSHFWWLY